MSQPSSRFGALWGTLDGKLKRLTRKLRRDSLDPLDKFVVVTHYALHVLRLYPHVAVTRHALFELTRPPQVLRGLRDLVVRPGTIEDLPALACVGLGSCEADGELLRRRFDRGDLLYVGQLEGSLLCQSWFHRGPRPFEEDGEHLAHWQLDGDTYWSYDAAAAPAARSSGLFVKVFQTALRDLFEARGARRVQCRVRSDNTSSVLMHHRTGFHRLGTLTALRTPVLRALQFRGPAGAARWLVPAGEALNLPVPPPPRG